MIVAKVVAMSRQRRPPLMIPYSLLRKHKNARKWKIGLVGSLWFPCHSDPVSGYLLVSLVCLNSNLVPIL